MINLCMIVFSILRSRCFGRWIAWVMDARLRITSYRGIHELFISVPPQVRAPRGARTSDSNQATLNSARQVPSCTAGNPACVANSVAAPSWYLQRGAARRGLCHSPPPRSGFEGRESCRGAAAAATMGKGSGVSASTAAPMLYHIRVAGWALNARQVSRDS